MVCLNANYQVTMLYSWNDNVQAVIKHPGKTDLLLEAILLNLDFFSFIRRVFNTSVKPHEQLSRAPVPLHD